MRFNVLPSLMRNTDRKPHTMQSLALRAVAFPLMLALAGCATQRVEPAGPTFVLVRHAEKGNDDPRDPSLAAAGRERASRLALSLQAAPLRAVYATTFRRTQQTAAPTAANHSLLVTTYDAARPADEFAAALRAAHATGTVLVVGHSNTVPALAQALCRCTIAPIADTEFGRRITISAGPDGRVDVDDRHEP